RCRPGIRLRLALLNSATPGPDLDRHGKRGRLRRERPVNQSWFTAPLLACILCNAERIYAAVLIFAASASFINRFISSVLSRTPTFSWICLRFRLREESELKRQSSGVRFRFFCQPGFLGF